MELTSLGLGRFALQPRDCLNCVRPAFHRPPRRSTLSGEEHDIVIKWSDYAELAYAVPLEY
jgi:hypothetical protein